MRSSGSIAPRIQNTTWSSSDPVRVSAKVPNSSFAEVLVGLLIEPTHMEEENEEEDERDGEECRVEGRRVSRQQHHADDTWMTCAQDTLSQCHVRH